MNSWLAGSIAGATAQIVVHPLDTIRARVHHDLLLRSSSAGSRNVYALKGLYRGLTLPLMAQSLYKAVLFSVYDECRSRGLSSPISGGLAGATNSIFVTPIEHFRSNLQVYRETGYGKIFSKGGLFRGLPFTCARDFVGVSAFFAFFELAKGETGSALLGGCAAGAGYWTFALPLDALKTQIQTYPEMKIVDILRKFNFRLILKRSLPLAYARGIPSAGIVFSVQSYLSSRHRAISPG